jgi:hypothetical protein
VDEPVITYAPGPDATPEAEITVLANVYKLCLDGHARKEAAPESRPDNPERRSNEVRAKARLQ